jgi:hypothetical protein
MCRLALSICLTAPLVAQTTTCNWTRKGSGSNGNQLGCAFTVNSGQERIYMIHLPQNFDPDKGLVFMYHRTSTSMAIQVGFKFPMRMGLPSLVLRMTPAKQAGAPSALRMRPTLWS